MTSVVDGQQRFFASYVRLSQTDNITNHSLYPNTMHDHHCLQAASGWLGHAYRDIERAYFNEHWVVRSFAALWRLSCLFKERN